MERGERGGTNKRGRKSFNTNIDLHSKTNLGKNVVETYFMVIEAIKKGIKILGR
ncbi:hypothetical protein ES703_91281 [subsurface metagenome]